MYKPLSMDTGDFALAVDKDTKKAYFIFSRPHFEVVTATLSDDYTTVTGEYSSHYENLYPPFSREAPAYFEHKGIRYLFTSGVTGYHPNPSRVCCFNDWHGEYKDLGDPCIGDDSKTSFYSQISSVMNVSGSDLYITLADRWYPSRFGMWKAPRFHKMVERAMKGDRLDKYKTPDREPKTVATLSAKQVRHMPNTSKSRYVWLPIEWEGDKPIIRWHDEWRIEDFIS
jgi:hypothetical protein